MFGSSSFENLKNSGTFHDLAGQIFNLVRLAPEIMKLLHIWRLSVDSELNVLRVNIESAMIPKAQIFSSRSQYFFT